MITVNSSSVKISFKSNKDAKVSIVRLKWIPDGSTDYVVAEKAFDATEEVQFSSGDEWQGYTIPSRIEIFVSIQSRNGNLVSDWSREASFYIDPDDDYEILSGVLTGSPSGDVTFTEFEEVE